MDNRLLKFAKAMRRVPTEAETALWRELRGKHFSGFKFKRQQPLGSYIVDFVCFERRVIIEVDGGQHGEHVDAGRTDWLQQQGFLILRFWNNDVLNDRMAVLESIFECLSSVPPLPNPSPARGEGLESGA